MNEKRKNILKQQDQKRRLDKMQRKVSGVNYSLTSLVNRINMLEQEVAELKKPKPRNRRTTKKTTESKT